MGVILNRVKTRTQIERDPRVLCEDDFRNGPQGWVQLISGSTPEGVLCLDSEITHNGSAYSLFIATEDYIDANSSNWSHATALKRLTRGNAMDVVRVEFVFAYGSQYAGTSGAGAEHALSPRMIQFGLDTAKYDGTRQYYSVRYLVASGSTEQHKFQVLNTDSTTYTDVPGATGRLALNENKRDLVRVEIEISLSTGKYRGLRVNGDGYGSLASTPDSTITALPGPLVESLPSFGGGMNAVFGIRNRNDTPNSRCWASLCYVKAVAL